MNRDEEQEKFAVDVGDFIEKLLERQAAVEQRQSALEKRQKEVEVAMAERQINFEKGEREHLEQFMAAMIARIETFEADTIAEFKAVFDELIARIETVSQTAEALKKIMAAKALRRSESGGQVN